MRVAAIDIAPMQNSGLSAMRWVCLGAALALTPTVVAAQDSPILSAEAEYERFAGAAKRVFDAGRYPQALSMTRQAHAFAAAELGATHLLTLRTLNDIAVIHQMQGDHAGALRR